MCVLLGACGTDSTRGSSVFRDLGAREPDSLLGEPEALVATPEGQWGQAGPRGWIGKTLEDEEGRSFVYSSSATPRFELQATGPAPRTIEIEAWLPGSGKESERRQSVPLLLNGQSIGAVDLTHRPRRERVAPPADLWRTGTNVLELRLGDEAARPSEYGPVTLAVSEVRYGHGRMPVRTADGTWRWPQDTGLGYRIVLDQPGELVLSGSSEQSGDLEVRFSSFDPAGSDRELEPESAGSATLGSGAFEERFSLPVPEGRVVQAELFWRGEGVLDVDRIRLGSTESSSPAPIILISIDTFSAQHTSLYGYERETTPNLKRFAEEGFTFRRCAANAPWTSASFAALFSGLYPMRASMKLVEGANRFDFELPRERWVLPEMLRAAGYRTGGFVDVIWLEERFGFRQGFEHYDTSASDIAHPIASGGIRHIRPRALSWIDSLPPGEPFFLFLHAYDVHGPYLPSDPWAGAFDGDEAAEGCDLFVGARSSFRTISKSQFQHAAPGERPPDQVDGGPFIQAYDEEILALDAALGELFDDLEQRGVLDRSWVILTGDHGEATCDHDYFGHGLLYDDTIQVPLVIRPPRGPWREHAGWVESSVQLVDLYPTLVELAGLSPEREHFHGRSLFPFLRGDTPEPRPTYCEGGIMRQSAVELDGWKLIEMVPAEEALPWTILSSPFVPRDWLTERAPQLVDVPPSKDVFRRLSRDEDEVRAFLDELKERLPEVVLELYDLEKDPFEENDLARERPEKVIEMLRILRSCQALREETTTGVDGNAPLTAEDLQRLSELGYADVEGDD